MVFIFSNNLGSDIVKRYSRLNTTEVNYLAAPEDAVPQDAEKNQNKIKQKGKIIGEDKEKRERNVKHFIKDNLTFEAAIYNEPVHYLKNGKWEDINNSLIEGIDDDSSPVLENMDNDVKVKFAKNAKAKRMVVVKKEKYEVAWGVNNVKAANIQVVDKNEATAMTRSYKNKKKLKKKSSNRKSRKLTRVIDADEAKTAVPNVESTVEFKEVFTNVDIQYDIKASTIKERIIIKEKISSSSITFNMTVKSLIPVLQQDNSINFYDDKNSSNIIFKMKSPFMYDSKGDSSSNIRLILSGDSSQYTLTYNIDSIWLNDKDRVMPIVIDPEVSTSLSSDKIKDSYVASKFPSSNYYTSEVLKVGVDSYLGDVKSFIKFTLPTEVTTADLVINAKMYLYAYTNSASPVQVNVQKVQVPWLPEYITYNDNIAFDSKIEDYQLVQGAQNAMFTWDITSIVKQWYSTGVNNGVLLKRDDNSSGFIQFYSSDASSISYRPLVRITYVNNSGIERYWTYHSQDVRRAGTGYINDYNGNLIFIHNDMNMSRSRMPLTINHVFNSNERDKDIGYGCGWRLNLSQRVDKAPASLGDMYVYTDDDGTKHYFKYDSTSATYKEELGLDFTLTFTTNENSKYNIKDKKDNILQFTSTGYLYKIIDKDGNTITLSYNGAILKSITDGAGRVTTLDVRSDGYLAGIYEPSGRRVKFDYTGAQLTKITYDDTTYSTFTYDSNKNLSVVSYNTPAETYKVTYSYYDQAPYRVKAVSEAESTTISGGNETPGGSLTLNYGYNTTSFKDGKGRKSVYQFNDNGNTLCIKEADDSAQYYKYSSGNTTNKLSLASKPQKFSRNYLKNHNAEVNGADWVLDYWGISNGAGSFTTEAAYMGTNSLKIVKNNTESRHFYSQLLNLSKGQTYVLSAYIKTLGITNQMGKGATLFVNYQDSTGNWVTVDSDYITGTNDWARYELKFTVPSNAASTIVYVRVGIVQEIGTAYIDCLQLEEGSIANRYNLMENADLYYGGDLPTYWSKNSSCGDNDKAVTQDNIRYILINGVANLSKNFYQTVVVNGKAGDVFSVGAWAKGSSVLIDGGRHFSLIIGILKTDNTYLWEEFFFNEDALEWQYITDRFETKADYKGITIYAVYYNNVNAACFTNFQLYKEEFGRSYKYDEKGNLKSVTDLAKQESTFIYDTKNNDLISVVNPAGAEFKYEYDNKHNVTKATSATNVVYSFTYDSNGNPIKAIVGGGSLFINSTARYSVSGNYLKSMSDSKDNSIIYHYDETRDLLIANTDAKGSKTTYSYDNMDRLVTVSKILGTRNVEYFALDNNTIGDKGTRPKEENAAFEVDPSGNSAFSSKVSTSKLYYDLGINKASGSMAIWFYPSSTGTRMILGNEGSNGEIFNLYINDQNKVVLNYRDSTNTLKNIISIDSITILNNQWYHAVLTWKMVGGVLSCTVYLNNTAYTGSVTDFKDFTGGITAIGSSIFAAYQLMGLLEKFVYTPNILTSTDVTTLYNKGTINDVGTTITNSYSYENDRIKSITHNGFSYSFDYDALGNNKAVSTAGQNLIQNTYELTTRNLIRSDYGNNQSISITYDNLDRIISRKFKDVTDTSFNERYNYQYDSAGNLGYHEDKVNNVNYRYIYDLADRLVKVVDSNDNSISFGYDINNNGNKVSYKINNTIYDTSYTFDKDNKPDGVYYGAALKNNANVQYFPLNGTLIGSKGTQPITQNPVYSADENGNTVLSVNSSGVKAMYDLGISKSFGTMSLWLNRKSSGGVQVLANEGTNQEILNLYLDSAYKVRLAVRTSTGVFTDLITSDEALNLNEWNFVALRWNLNGSTLTTNLFLNSKIYTNSTSDFKDFSGGKTALGTSINGLYPINAFIKDFAYSSFSLTDVEILAMYHNNSLKYEYDSIGRVTKKKLNTGSSTFETQFNYVNNVITGSTTNKVASINNNGVTINYEYDAKGNITKITQGVMSIIYYYNDLNELVQEDNQVLNKTIIYSYDLGGNLKSKLEIPYDGTARVTTAYTYDTVWKDKLISYGSNPLTYDAIGNLKTYNGYTYSWEEGRQLKSIIGNGRNISFKYNDNGIRTEKTVDGVTTKYFLSGNKVILEDNGSDRIYYTYDRKGHLVSMNLNGVEYYYMRNIQGDIIGLFDKNGTKVVNYVYDSWGKLISINGTLKDTVGVKNPYRYRGYRVDSETGLYYLQSRYYNPEWGRFVNADNMDAMKKHLDEAVEKPGSDEREVIIGNLFEYCGNNPIVYSDPGGQFGMRDVNEFMIRAELLILAPIIKATYELNTSFHAVQRMLQRGISREEVEDVLSNGAKYYDEVADSIVYYKDRIAVAVKDSKITTIYNEADFKYWRWVPIK